MRFVALTGRKFGRLTVLRRAERQAHQRHWHWHCRCACGTELVVLGGHLPNGHTQSCGCLRVDTTTGLRLRHGHSRAGNHSPTHRSWRAMQTRCDNPRQKDWKDYGGRGITVCDRWRSFDAFLADMGERPEGMTLDRIDTNGNYEPGNCRWATNGGQARNRRKRVIRNKRDAKGRLLPIPPAGSGPA